MAVKSIGGIPPELMAIVVHVLNVVTLTGALLVKAPQIINIIKRKSVTGIIGYNIFFAAIFPV